MRVFVCLLILAAVARADTSVSASATSARARRHRPVGYIVPEARGRQFLTGAKRYWTPTQEQVDRLEAHLVVHLRDTAPGELWKRIDRYGRQYVGFFDAKGRRRIWVNLFVLDEDFNAETIARQVVDVDDGGDDFCRITWDVGNDAFADFNCNGVG